MANFTLNSDNNKKPGTAYADIIDGLDGNDTLSGLSGDDLLLGGNGLDSLDGGTGADTLKGGSGADVLLGNTDNDRLLGEDGNDSLDGGNGADTLDGGTGGDRLTGGDGDDYFAVDNLADQISEADTETGTDTVASLISFSLPDWIEHLILLGMETLTGTGNALNNRLTGNDAANGLDGGNGMDTLIGGAGADTLDGGFGVDELIGGDGDDLYRVSSTEDKLIETAGGGDQDEVQSSVDFSLIDYLENLTLTGFTALRGMGNRVANRLTGNVVANDLSGEAGDDTLQGGAGDDTLTGGQGNDVLDGGDGTDTVMFPGNLNGYSITQADATTWQVIDTNPRDGDDGSDSLSGIERIAFADAIRAPADFIAQLPGVSVADVSRPEGTGKTNTLFKFPVTLTAPATTTVTVNYSLQGGTATPGQDYLNKNGSLRFNPGETRQFVTVAVKADSQVESDENFTLQLARPVGASLTRATATATLQNDDVTKAGPPSLSIAATRLSEGSSGAALAVLDVSLSAPSGQIVTVNYSTADDTAQAGSDYLASRGILSFAPGVTRTSIKVPVLGDTGVEPDERFSLLLSEPLNAVLGSTSSASVTISNDDQPQLSLRDTTLIEGSEGTTAAEVEVVLSLPSHQTVTVDYTTRDGTALAGFDYTATTGTLRFAPGETRQTLRVPVTSDTTVETDEQFTLVFDAPVNALPAASGDTTTVTLRNDDLPELTLESARQAEGDTDAPLELTVSLSTAVSQTVSVRYRSEDDTALAGSDYTATSGTLTFQPGETRQTLSIPVRGDTEAEPGESFKIWLERPENAVLVSPELPATVTLDNDDLPVIRLADLSEAEGNDGLRYLSLELTLSAAPDQMVLVNYRLEDGTATAGSDYLPLDGSVIFSPGQTRQTVELPVFGDSGAEADEAFTLRLADPLAARLDSRDYATITLMDDDTPSLALTGTTLQEGNSGRSNASLTVSLSAAYSETVTVDYATADGTARAGSDYTATSGSLSFAPGETRKTINVGVTGDTLYEADERFQVKLANASSNARIDTSASTATVAVTNDDAQPVLALSGTSVTEGNSGSSNVSLTVSLSAASSQPVTVDYATADGTARAGSDYTATSGSLSFAPGETRKTINVGVKGDTLYEADEDFRLVFSNPTHARLTDSTARVVIGNDDLRNNEVKGQAVIDLGKNYGKLIKPVQVDGHTYYFWDVSGDGTRANTQGAGYANSTDYVTHDWLDNIFQQDVNGRVEGKNGAPVVGTDSDTDNTYRFATLNGVKLALPTLGNGDDFIGSGETGYQNGTGVSGTASNPTYDDYLAIWDAYNGTGTGTRMDGTPGGWRHYTYWWSATPSGYGHANIGLSGRVYDDTHDSGTYYVAVEVW